MKRLIVIALAMLSIHSTYAEKLALVGAKIHTMSEQGVIEKGSVLVSDGNIVSVIEGTEVPSEYRVVDVSGKVISPGFIGALTSLGLVEVSSSSGVVDASIETSPITKTGAALDVSYGINPDSSLFEITRLEGMTAAATGMMGGHFLFNGQGAVISLDGDEPVIKSQAFISVDVGGQGAEVAGGSRASLWVMLEKVINEAASTKSNVTSTTPWFGLSSREDLPVIKQVIAGDIPLFMKADRTADIRQVIAFKKRHPSINLVLVHGVEAWREAKALAEAKIPVIIDPEYNLPGGFDQMGATLANAARLEQAGVEVAIGMDTHNIRLAAQHAGNAVANGLSYEAGLASLTRVPAKILGLDSQIGVLAKDARADIVVWSGDPLEVTEAAEMVIINGQFVDMESRQTKLRDRYLSLMQSDAKKPSYYYR